MTFATNAASAKAAITLMDNGEYNGIGALEFYVFLALESSSGIESGRHTMTIEIEDDGMFHTLLSSSSV